MEFGIDQEELESVMVEFVVVSKSVSVSDSDVEVVVGLAVVEAVVDGVVEAAVVLGDEELETALDW